MNNEIYDLIIIGSGPAGLTAAIYSSRATITTLVIAGSPSGGQLTTTTEVENFPGFPEGIQGPVLIENMRKQAERFGSKFLEEKVASIQKTTQGNFEITLDTGMKIQAKSVIVASGASAKWLGIESEQRLRGKGVSACATCDAFFFKNKVVAVVGGGDSAMEESVYLTKFASKVYVVVRKAKNELRASKYMQERALSNPKIEFLFETGITEVLGDAFVSGLRIKNLKTGAEKILSDVGGLFLAIGHSPNTGFLKGFIELDPVGYIKVSNLTNTSVKGVFSAGDVGDSRYRQAISAAGLGCMAALDVEKYLASAEHENK